MISTSPKQFRNLSCEHVIYSSWMAICILHVVMNVIVDCLEIKIVRLL